ncbi:MAG: 50S ribosomal protein L16 [Candidatus Aenigmatarchaeota archaeon]|nr:MAG: 50S ribosomal protein L16 [Candidatus Aenigmarchaeota archaeon ex4484_14]RLI97428.1 MAG: 50S ribosomal protein L16 [Candidatus Aenigmarchaeota archaeon]
MALRPAKCYRKVHRAYTRVSRRKPRKSYVKGVPGSKIHQFEMGEKGNYDYVLYLVAKQSVQIRHNALEAARMAVTQHMTKKLGKGKSYFFKVRPYPHQVLRENPLATGAGADRFQQGMRMSFGRPIGTAAIVKPGQKILELHINNSGLAVAKKALKIAAHKLPTTTRIVIEETKTNK